MKFGGNDNRWVKTLKGLKKISKEERLTQSLTLSGLGDVLNIPVPRILFGAIHVESFQD